MAAMAWWHIASTLWRGVTAPRGSGGFRSRRAEWMAAADGAQAGGVVPNPTHLPCTSTSSGRKRRL